MRLRKTISRAVYLLLAFALALVTLGGCSAALSDGDGWEAADATETSSLAEAEDDLDESATIPAPEASSEADDPKVTPEKEQAPPANEAAMAVEEDGTYTSPEEVALYIHTYGHLPSNFISKTKARKAGWVSSEGNLDEVLPGMSIGGSVYYNEGWDGEELLPEAPGRTWTECDVNYHGGFRGAERLVFSNDGLIFYTDDHYKTFTQLY